MNCIIGTDKVTCKVLEEFAGKSSSLNLIGTFTDSALLRNQLSSRQDIDLVFLDSEILKLDNFNFLNSPDYKPNVIIISSGDKNSLKPYDINVIDYLLKPVDYTRFSKAIDKAIRYYSGIKTRISDDNEIFIKKGSALVRLKLSDIIYIEAIENNLVLSTNHERYSIHFTLKAFEKHLPAEIFIRIHQSLIVNKTRIHSINENNLELIVGDNHKNLPVGSSFRDLLLNNLNRIVK